MKITNRQKKKVLKIASAKGIKTEIDVFRMACHLLDTLITSWEHLSFQDGRLFIKKLKAL